MIPIAFTRTYIANDSRSRAFGIGSIHNYDIFTVGDVKPWTYQELILPDGGRVRFDRISTGTSWLDAVYASTTSEGAFYGAKMSWVIANDPGAGKGWHTRQLPVPPLPPHPQLQTLALLIDFMLVNPVARSAQNFRPLALSHPTEDTQSSPKIKTSFNQGPFQIPAQN